MRRRVRRLLARISPDLLRQRAERARASTGLRRWVAEPGVDAWFGTFPSEEAATAWAAVDRLAHRYVADGVCTSVEQARGRALTDLVTGNATVDVQVVLTVPAAAAACAGERATGSSNRAGEDLIEVQGARPSEPMFVPRAWLTGHLADAREDVPRTDLRREGADRRRRHPGDVPHAPCDPRSGARLDPQDALATTAYRPGAELVELVRARDGRCRFPGCAVAARFCDLDHVRPWPTGATTATNLLCLCRRHHRIKQSAGWTLRLDSDGTAAWTDPVGAVRSTAPLNALDATVLRHEPTAEVTSSGTTEGSTKVRAPWSVLETRLELHLEHAPHHRRCTSAGALRAATHRSRTRAPVPDTPPF